MEKIETFEEWYAGAIMGAKDEIDLRDAWNARQSEIDALKEQIDKLNKECFSLSSQCCVAKDCGISFDEGTSLYCKHEINIKRMANCLNCENGEGFGGCKKNLTTVNFRCWQWKLKEQVSYGKNNSNLWA